jgi:outer membrane protein TolC
MENGKWLMVDGKQNSEFRPCLPAGRIQNSEVRRGNILYGLCCLVLYLFQTTMTNGQSIDSLVSEGLKNNQMLKSLEYKINSVEFRTESVNTLPPPNLGIEFNQIPIGKINIWDKAISNSISLSQMFPIGGKVNPMTEVERKNVAVTKDDYEIYKINLISQIKMVYYNIWQMERKIEIQQKNSDLLNEMINSINVSYQVNRINQADVFTIQSEIASNKTQLLILQNQRQAEVYKLNKLLGRNLNSLDLKTEREIIIDSLKYSQSQLEEILVNKNLSLQKMNSMVAMNEAMIIANNRELIPDLMVQGMLMRMPQGMLLTSKTDLSMLAMETPKTEYMYSLMASINLPFAPWSINKYKAKEEELYSGIKGIESEKNDMQREMLSQLKTAFVKLNTSDELIKLYSKEVIPSYQRAVEAQVSAYQNSRTNINTVLDSNRMLLMQQMNYYMAQTDHQMAIAEIEMMVGVKMNEL